MTGRACALAVVLACTLPAGAAAQVPEWPSERPPRALEPRDIKFPPYEIRTLPNGLRVVAVSHHEQPAISMRVLVGAGSADDPASKHGLARLFASLLDQGTATRSARELNDAIDSIGGIMGAGAGSDLVFVNMVVMKDSFETGMRMLADMVERPAFSPEEIDRQRQQQLSFMRVSLDDPAFIANAVFDRMVYGSNPYGMPDGGTPETLAGITRNDLVAFHQKYFVPNNAILAIVGDVTAEDAFATVSRVFGAWASKDVTRQRFVEPPAPARRVVIIDRPGAVQTEIRVGSIGIPRSHPDFMPLNLAMRVLGGEGSNRLHQILRTERGLTYGAQATMETRKESGDLMAETNTRSDATGEALRLIVDEMWRLQRERVSEGELAAAKAYMTGSFPLTIETPDSIALQVLNAVFYGLPLEDLQTFRERVNRITVDDVERVARFYLKPDASAVVLVGDASVFEPQLRSVGFGRFDVVPIEQLDLLAPDFRRAAGARIGRAGEAGPAPRVVQAGFRQASAVVPEEGARARALLERVIEAKGGLATLQGVKTIRAVTDATMLAPDGEVEAETTTYLQYPDRVRVETQGPQGLQVQVYDGTRGWVRDPLGVHDVPASAVRDMEANLKRDTIAALLAAEAGDLRARVLPDVKDGEGVLHAALELSSPELDPVVLYVDAETGLVSKQAYVARAPGQPLIEELYSDYRRVDGVMVAFAAEVRAGGKAVVRRRLSEITINAPIQPRLFTRPN